MAAEIAAQRAQVDGSAVRMRWLSEPAAWHPHWSLHGTGRKQRALFAVLSPAAEDEDDAPADASIELPPEQLIVLAAATDPATCRPEDILRFALVCRTWSGWMRGQLRSSAMAPFWIRMA